MPVSLARLARNQILFREVNERIAELDRLRDGPFEFLCECSDVACTDALALELNEYDAVRARPRHFVIVPGHEITAVARVVEERDRFTVVERTIAIELPAEVDPPPPR